MVTAFSIQAECLKINHALLPVDILLRLNDSVACREQRLQQLKVQKCFHTRVLPHLLRAGPAAGPVNQNTPTGSAQIGQD